MEDNMLILEATTDLQGQRPTDYNWCEQGELVYLAFQECSRPSCGCTRGFAGLDSHRATTTARVAERPDLTIEGLAQLIARSLCDGGWIDRPDPGDELVSWLATEVVETANSYVRFGIGTVIEREGDQLQRRLRLDAA